MNFVEAVFVFAALSAAFEAILISKLPPRLRLKVLGSERMSFALHSMMFGLNLLIHYGTLVGSMTAITAGLTSFMVLPILKLWFGRICNGAYYPGIWKYDPAQLAG